MLHTTILQTRDAASVAPIAQPQTIIKEMGCTAEELIRLLPAVRKHEPIHIDRARGRAVIGSGARRVVVAYARQAERRLGRLSLPVLKVELHFEGHSDEQARAFGTDFDRGFLRMGGG